MVKLKSRTKCPVGGFLFTQPQTGASFSSWGFDDLCRQIQAHRKGNPRFNLTTDLGEIAEEVDLANATRMLSIPGAEIYVDTVSDPGGTVLPKPLPRSPRNAAVAAVAGARKVAAGVPVLLDWLGQGGAPVDYLLACARAAVCASCPENQSGDLTSWFTQPVSNLIRRQIQNRNAMGLSTPLDDKLGVCAACACPLHLKVHCPIEHISAHLGPEIQADLAPQCWIRSEIKKANEEKK